MRDVANTWVGKKGWNRVNPSKIPSVMKWIWWNRALKMQVTILCRT